MSEEPGKRKSVASVEVDQNWDCADSEPVNADSINFVVRRPITSEEAKSLAAVSELTDSVTVTVSPAKPRVQEIPLEFLRMLPKLTEFRLLDFEFRDFGQLDQIPPSVMHLTLRSTRSSLLSLRFLKNLPVLETLSIERHCRDIHHLSSLTNLKWLSLRSVPLDDLSVLRSLCSLQSFELLLGGTTDLSSLGSIPSLKRLSIWKVRGLNDLNVVSDCLALEELEVQDLAAVTELPDMSGNRKLRAIRIQNLVRLTDFSRLSSAPNLECLDLTHAQHVDLKHLQEVLPHTSIRKLHIALGSDRKNREMDLWASINGYEQLYT